MVQFLWRTNRQYLSNIHMHRLSDIAILLLKLIQFTYALNDMNTMSFSTVVFVIAKD